jgi:hypothetical protein
MNLVRPDRTSDEELLARTIEKPDAFQLDRLHKLLGVPIQIGQPR